MIFDVIAKVKVFEYRYIGAFLGNWINTLKMAFADFNLAVIEQQDPLFELDTATHYLYWFIWFICVIFSALILLNFIIAEVCNSYQKVKDNLEALIYKERATLIQESEVVMSDWTRNNNKKYFPTYIVCRE